MHTSSTQVEHSCIQEIEYSDRGDTHLTVITSSIPGIVLTPNFFRAPCNFLSSVAVLWITFFFLRAEPYTTLILDCIVNARMKRNRVSILAVEDFLTTTMNDEKTEQTELFCIDATKTTNANTITFPPIRTCC